MADIISCPACQRKLQVPEAYFGQNVQCPECQHTFVAGSGTTGVQSNPAPAAPPRPSTWQEPPDPAPRRRRYEDDDFDEYDDVGRLRRPDTPHRGGTILAMGILSIVLCGIIFGPIAWVMGNTDMVEIGAGRMDRTGEGLTQAGRVLGIIGTVLGVLQVLYVCGMCGVAAIHG